MSDDNSELEIILSELRSEILPPEKRPCKICHRNTAMHLFYTCVQCSRSLGDRKCDFPDCMKKRYYGSDYCNFHSKKCRVEGCKYSVWDQKLLLCRRHLYPCRISKCTNYAELHKYYCKIHLLSEDTCDSKHVHTAQTTLWNTGLKTSEAIHSNSDSNSKKREEHWNFVTYVEMNESLEPLSDKRNVCYIKGCTNQVFYNKKCRRHRYCFMVGGIVYENEDLKRSKRKNSGFRSTRISSIRQHVELSDSSELLNSEKQRKTRKTEEKGISDPVNTKTKFCIIPKCRYRQVSRQRCKRHRHCYVYNGKVCIDVDRKEKCKDIFEKSQKTKTTFMYSKNVDIDRKKTFQTQYAIFHFRLTGTSFTITKGTKFLLTKDDSVNLKKAFKLLQNAIL